jgi:NADH-quinone oxidoreductase subunit K
VITLAQLLTLSGIVFALAVAGVFLNRKNVILLLMCVELLLLAANFNFIAFSRYLGDLNGQVFVFFILTVAAAESAIGLAIMVALFRSVHTINVDELDSLKG